MKDKKKPSNKVKEASISEYASPSKQTFQTAKIFMNGRSQAVRLPAAFRFEGDEVFIRQNPHNGDVILSRKPRNWDGFFNALKGVDIPHDFLNKEERDQNPQIKDPFEGWEE